MKRLFLLFLIVLAGVYSPTRTAFALIIEDRPFTYGTLVITDNSAVYSMRIRQNGNISPIDPQIIQIGTVNSAQHTISGFPGNTNLNVTYSVANLTGPGANFFTVNNFDFTNNPRTDGAGVEVLQTGSTFSTSGNGLPYTDGSYTGTMTLTVTF